MDLTFLSADIITVYYHSDETNQMCLQEMGKTNFTDLAWQTEMT